MKQNDNGLRYYCPKCAWRSEENVAMKPICPECGTPLRLERTDNGERS